MVGGQGRGPEQRERRQISWHHRPTPFELVPETGGTFARSCFCFSCSNRYKRLLVINLSRDQYGTCLIQHLYGHCDIGWLARNNHQTFALSARLNRRTINPNPNSTRLHDLDLACTDMPDLINFASSFPNDTPDKVIRDVNLLCLELLWRVMGCIRAAGVRTWYIGGSRMYRTRSTGITWSIGCIMRGHAFLSFQENDPNVVSRDVDSVCYTCNAENPLEGRYKSTRGNGRKIIKWLPLSSREASPRLRSIWPH